MKIYFANASFRKNDIRGRTVHILQFIEHNLALGNEVWMEVGTEHAGIQVMPRNRLARIRIYRQMDVIYVRIQGKLAKACRYSNKFYRLIMGNPLNVWEFNTFPAHVLKEGEAKPPGENGLAALKKYGRNCDLAVCVSSRLHNFIQEDIGIQNSIVVPNGSDPALFNPSRYLQLPVAKDPRVLKVIWIGSADLDWNDFDQLLSAAKIINASGLAKKIEFHIIGKGFSHIDECPQNMFYHGPVSYYDLPPWLAAMDVGLIIYHSGGANYNSPLKLFDYMASGLAVVSNEQPQVREILSQIGGESLIVSSGDPIKLAEVLVSLIQDREKVRKIGIAGREKVIDTYNWHRAIAVTNEKMKELLILRGRHA